MTDPKAHEIIAAILAELETSGCDADSVAHAVIGALATGGYAIVAVDPQVVSRVLAEMAKEQRSK